MLPGPRSAIIIVLTALCPFTVYAKSHSLGCGATKPSETKIFATGAISGKVTRTDGTTAILSATVKVYQGTSLAGSATTNAAGDYTVGALNTGTYAIETSAVGYETTTQTGISVTDGSTTTLNVSLPVPINYVYDQLGRLVAVIDKDGSAATYSYDAVGNLLSISRQVPTQVSIIQFSPGSGPVGALVTIYGAGFSATASQNTVTFNGASATVTASSTNVIITTVPAGATTGTIAVTSPIGSATSGASFTVAAAAGAPTITGFTPAIASSGAAVTINGANFETTPINNTIVFNTTSSQTNSATAISIGTTVPAQTGSGRISVATPAGKTVSSADFFIPPSGYTAADVEFTGRMSIGGATTATISTANKIAMIVFDGTANQQVSIRMTGCTIADSWVRLYSPYANILGLTEVGSAGLLDTVTLPATGTYTILIDPTSTYTGSMPLTLYDCTEITGTITPGGPSVTVTPSVPGQNARLTFNGSAGQRISLNMTGVTITSSWIYIYKPTGSLLTSAGVPQGSYFLDTVTLPFTGKYTILVDPTGVNTGSMTLTLYDVPPDASGTITIGGPAVSTTITTPGQGAQITFSGTAGQKVSVSTSNSTITVAWLSIRKPDGSTLSSAQVFTGAGLLDGSTLPITGTYTIVVDPSFTYIGSMTLTLNDASDINGTLTIGGPTVTVTITAPGQNAVLTFSGTANQQISLSMTNGSIANGSVYIKKPDGSTLATASTTGTFIDTQTLPTTGTYTVLVDPYSSSTGSLTLTLNDCTEITGTITPGGSAVTLTIPIPGQNAKLTFSGTAGQRISLNIPNNATIALSFVTIKKPDSTTLVSTWVYGGGGGGVFIDTQTLPAAGTYTIVVDPNSNYTGSITLTLYDVPANITGTLTVGGASLPVTITTPGQNASITFSGTASQQVTVHVTGNTINSVTVKLLKPDGSLMTIIASSLSSFNLATQTLATTGTYTIDINPGGANTGGLNVSVTSP